jgi:hypothetical protein
MPERPEFLVAGVNIEVLAGTGGREQRNKLPRGVTQTKRTWTLERQNQETYEA